MKKSFIFCLIFLVIIGGSYRSAFPQQDRHLSYTIKPVFVDDSLRLDVELKFEGDPTGQSLLRLPNEWAGQEALYENLVRISTAQSSVIIEETGHADLRLIRHKPSQALEIHYSVIQPWKGALRGERFQKYMPIFDPEHFHFYGMVFFAYPDGLAAGPVTVELNWKGFPKDWAMANSFGCGERMQSFSASVERLQRSVYVGGNYRIKHTTVRNQPVFIAIRGGDWRFPDKVFFNFVEHLIGEHRTFWNDFDFPYFLVVLNPFGTGHKNFGGTALNRSFDVFFYADADFNLNLKHLFAHELFHTWNTAKLGMRPDPEGLIYWFSEGFTDYYARLLLLRAGGISLEEYVSDFNTKLQRYFLSPSREAANTKIAEGYWSDEDIGRLPYQRGDILAHRWNFLIKEKTGGGLNLDDLMRRLYRGAKPSGQVLSAGLIVHEILELTGLDLSEEAVNFIENGELIPITGEELGPCFKLKAASETGGLLDRQGRAVPQYEATPGRDSLLEKRCRDWFGIRRP